MGMLTIPILILSIVGFVFTVRLVNILNNSNNDGLKETLQNLRAIYPASGVYHGVNIEVGFLIYAAIMDGLAIAITIRVVLIMQGWHLRCPTWGHIWGTLNVCENVGPARMLEDFKWMKPTVLYSVQVVRLVVLGSIWNKCSFYGLFCWGSGPVLKWQDALSHLLEMVFFWKGSATATPSGLSRSGAPNSCAFQEESQLIRSTLLLSFITYFVIVPLTYMGCFWNYDVALSSGAKVRWALVSGWGFIWAFFVNAFINIKFMLSLAALLTLQAYYIGSGHGTAQLVIAIMSCLQAAGTAYSLWCLMQYILRHDMFTAHLIAEEPQPFVADLGCTLSVLDYKPFTMAGAFSITLYCICAKQLQGSQLFQVELAFGIMWICLSVLIYLDRLPVYLLALPSRCTISMLQVLVVLVDDEVEGPKEDIEMQVVTEPPAPLERITAQSSVSASS